VPTPTTDTASAAALTAQVASSDLAVGPNRFTFGLIDRDHPVESGRPSLTLYALKGNTGVPVETVKATFNHFAQYLKDTPANSAAAQIGGVWVAHVTFPHAGQWAGVVKLRYNGRDQSVQTSPFSVARHSLAPAVGSLAPRTNNPTTATVPATKLDSGRPPDDMHLLSIAQAIAQHKPLVVLFATAAYCQSRLCGPEIEVVQGLERQFRGPVNFVHIEIYKNANPQYGLAPAVQQWRLQTEPWVFVIDRSGRISARFQGPTTAGEIAPAIQQTLR
jgi:hypothetical protein